MRANKLSIAVVIALLVFSVSGMTTAGTDAKTNFSTLIKNSSPQLDVDGMWYGESAEFDVSPEGNIWTRVSLSGNSIDFGTLDIKSRMPEDMKAIFVWADFHTWQNKNPWEMNANLNFKFLTNDPNIAENAAKQMIAAMSSQIHIEFEFRGSSGYDENWGGDWVQLTDVSYDARVEWIGMIDVIETSIPRSYGGLAETVNITEATHLSYHLWNEGGGSFGATVGVEFGARAPSQTGGFSYILDHYFHVDYLRSPTVENSETNIHIRLPDVTGINLGIGNTSYSEVHMSYNPSPESHNLHHAWYIDVRIFDSAGLFNDVVLEFNYEHIQWTWVAQDNLWWDVDARGYDSISIASYGKDRMAMTPNTFYNSILFTNLRQLNFWLRENNESWIDIEFYGHGGHDAEFAAIITELNTLGLGYPTTADWKENKTYYYERTDTWVEYEHYHIWHEISGTPYTDVITSTYGFDKSAALSMTDLNEYTEFWFKYGQGRWGIYGEMGLHRNGYYENAPASAINPSFSQSLPSHHVSMYNPSLAGWTGNLPWNSYSEVFSFHFTSPYNGNWDELNFGPDQNNGISWNTGRWDEYRDNSQRIGYNGQVWSQNPTRTDQHGNDLGIPITNFNLTFANNFLDDSADIRSPDISWFAWRNDSYPDYGFHDQTSWPHEFSGENFDGMLELVVSIDDFDHHAGEYWDGSTLVPKFPSSGIAGVNATLFREDAPVNHEKFNFVYSDFSYHSPDGRNEFWTGSLNLTDLADGSWSLDFETMDNAGNYGRSGGTSITIDNYQGTTPAIIDWGSSPADGSSIDDITFYNFTVTDDVGSYAVIVWTGLGGWIIDAEQVIDNGDGTVTEYYSFAHDTLFELENELVTVKIEVLDMDGHWIDDDRTYMVDNEKQGNPPTITLYHPDDNSEFNASENHWIHFAAEVVDDWGLKSVKVDIDGIIFNMVFNGTHYIYDLDISTWFPDPYEWNVVAIDVDENEHTVTSESRSFEIVGDGPLIEDTEDPYIALVGPTDYTVSGEVRFEVNATDNYKVGQVVYTLPDGTEVVMNHDSGTGLYYSTWDSASVIDATYTFTFIASDTTGNTASVSIDITTDNGRTQETPELGLPGFEIYMAIISTLSVILIRRKKR